MAPLADEEERLEPRMEGRAKTRKVEGRREDGDTADCSCKRNARGVRVETGGEKGGSGRTKEETQREKREENETRRERERNERRGF